MVRYLKRAESSGGDDEGSGTDGGDTSGYPKEDRRMNESGFEEERS